MASRFIRFALFCRVVLILLAAFVPPLSAMDGAPSPDSARESPYGRAIRDAEADLKALEDKSGAAGGGWGISEYLSVAALVLAVGIMLWTARFTRRLSWRKVPGREMRLVDRMTVGRQSSLLVVRLRGRDYWLAESPNGIALLAELPPEKDGGDA